MRQCKSNGVFVNKYENFWSAGKMFDAAGKINLTTTDAIDNIAANVVILFGFELSQRSCGALPDVVVQRLKQAVKTRCAHLSVLAGASPPGDDSRQEF